MASDSTLGSVVTSSDTGDPRRYQQMANEVRALILSGKIAPGNPAPTITDLARRHGAARQTCAKALQLLATEGLLTRYPGAGYYVVSSDGARPAPLGQQR